MESAAPTAQAAVASRELERPAGGELGIDDRESGRGDADDNPDRLGDLGDAGQIVVGDHADASAVV
jgi:hypothetical protein